MQRSKQTPSAGNVKTEAPASLLETSATHYLTDLELEKAIGELTDEVIASYQESKKTHQLGSHLSVLNRHLQTGWLRESEALTDKYLDCASRLLNSVLRDKSTTDQFIQESFGSYRRYQQLFLHTLYLGLLRPWIVPASQGALLSVRHLERYLDDLRQRAKPDESKWFDGFDTRIGDQAGLRYTWHCCLHALQLLPKVGGWRRGAQVLQALFEPSVTLPVLPDSVPTEAKIAVTVVKTTASLGFNIYRYIQDHYSPPWFARVIDVQVDTQRALHAGSTLPDFRPLFLPKEKTKEDKYNTDKVETPLPDWQIFWAVADACLMVLRSPLATYQQCRQAMGDWAGQTHAETVNLASLIEHWLDVHCYQKPECLGAVLEVLRQLLDVQTPLAGWIRQLAQHGWVRLSQPQRWVKDSPWANDYTRSLQAKIDQGQAEQEKARQVLETRAGQQQAPFLDEQELKETHLIDGVHAQAQAWQDQPLVIGLSHSSALYAAVAPQVAYWSVTQQVTFYTAAGLAHYPRTNSPTAVLWLQVSIRHYFTAWQIADQDKLESEPAQAADLMGLLVGALARVFPSLFVASLQVSAPFAHLPPESKDQEWGKATQAALEKYVELVRAFSLFSQELCAWGLVGQLPPLFAVLQETHRAYLATYAVWIKWVKQTMAAGAEQALLWSAPYLARTQDYRALAQAWTACGQGAFFYQGKEDSKSDVLLLPPPKENPWREWARDFTQHRYPLKHSWFKPIADWLNARLPPPPCAFKPFIVKNRQGHYRLGLELADSFYRHHPFFSGWAECFRLCVGLGSAYACELDVSGVSHLSQECLPEMISAHRELVTSSTGWRENATPMVRFDSPARLLDLHGQLLLPQEAKTQRRPHAIAKGLQFQQYLLALTTDQPAKKTPVVQLAWPGATGRYLSPALTQRLFHTRGDHVGQIIHTTRSATPGQCDVWRLTANDAHTFLPECASETILAYLKVNPQNPWRQWQQLTLAERLIDYGYTGTLATLCYGEVVDGRFQLQQDAKPIPVWLSSPAGLTFCTPMEVKQAELKDKESTSDIQVLDESGEARFRRCLAQLDPRCFTQAVFLTWLLVHEDDQLRNLGFEPLVNTQGEGVFRIIAFDTDTALEAPWIRTDDGRIQIKLKSLLFCLEAMQRPLDESARRDFLALEPETVLIDWLTPLAEIKIADNHLPPGSIEALYQRWRRLRQVLQLPLTSDDPMAPILPHNHLELLTQLDPPLGAAYGEAFQSHATPLARFTAVSQPDYVWLGGMSVSASSGLLRSHSLTQPREVKARDVKAMASLHTTPRDALTRCEAYRQNQKHCQRLVAYLTQQAQTIQQVDPLFERQITLLVGEIQALNQETRVELDRRLQQKSRLERATTRLHQWEPLTYAGLLVEIVLLEKPTPLSLAAWQAACVRQARAGLRLVQGNGAWRLWIHNGNYLVAEAKIISGTLEYPGEWDLHPLQKSIMASPIDAKAIRQACHVIYQQQLLALQAIQKALLASEARLKRLAELRQDKLLPKKSGTVKAWYDVEEKHPHFLTGLLDVTLRQAVVNQLAWGSLPPGKGTQQLLRLLELGGLSELNIQDCQEATDAHLIAFLQNSPDLIHLNISGCSHLTSRTLTQCASSTPSLLRLSARQLPGLTDLWRGILWATRTPLIFSQLTHADFRGCVNLMRIQLQAPTLRYLHLGGCGLAIGWRVDAQDWTLITPQLKVVSLKGCRSLTRIKIESAQLEHIDAQDSAITLPLLQAMLMPEDWRQVTFLQLPYSESLAPWVLLSAYPFLIPLANEGVSADQLSVLHQACTLPSIAKELSRLPAGGRQRLQLGLALFLLQQPQKWLPKILRGLSNAKETYVWDEVIGIVVAIGDPILASKALNACLPFLKDSDGWVRQDAARAVGQIGAAHAALAQQALNACLPLLKDSGYGVSGSAVKAIGQIGAAHAGLAQQALNACLPLLKDSDYYVRKDVSTAIGQIGAAHAGLAQPALNACLPLLKDSDENVRCGAVRAVGQIGAAHAGLAQPALNACLPLLKDWHLWVRESAARAVGQIGAAHAALAQQALNALPLLKDSEYYRVRLSAATAVGQIAAAHAGFAHAELAQQALNACLPLLKDSNEWARESATTVVGQIGVAHAALAQQALNGCLPLLKDSKDHVRQAAATTVGQIGAAHAALAQQALNTCLPLLKDSGHDVSRSATTAIGQIGAAHPTLVTDAFQAILPLLKATYTWSEVHHAAMEALLQSFINKVQPKLIYPLLKALSDLVDHRDVTVRFNTMTLLLNVNADYHVQFGQTLEDYIIAFLRQWFIDHPVESTSAPEPAPPPPDSPPDSLETKSSSTTRLLTLSAQGNDRCLAQHGGERSYWYSVTDFCLLTTMIREQQLHYFLPSDSKDKYKAPGGELASAYRQNQLGIFIADPYVHLPDCPFRQSLSEDMAIITGTHPKRRHDGWSTPPQHLFFSVWHHHHWRLIGLEIDYTDRHYRILWDDPFGKERFSESLYEELLPSLQTAVRTLFKIYRSLNSSTVEDTKENSKEDSKTEIKAYRVIKALDQQGRGINGYDCGPIVGQNLQDYLLHLNKKAASLTSFEEKHYTIPAASATDWEKILRETRQRHWQEAQRVTTTPATPRLISQQTALTQAQQERQAQCLSGAKNGVPSALVISISRLPSEPLGVLFATIDHQRLLDIKPLDLPDTPEELHAGYRLLYPSQDSSSTALTDSPPSSHPERDKPPLSLLFPASSSTTLSSSATSTLTSTEPFCFSGRH